MKTFEITRDIVYGDIPYIIIAESDIETMRTNAAKAENDEDKDTILKNIEYLEEQRVEAGDKLRTETITLKSPTPADRIDIRSACVGKDGMFNSEYQSIEACKVLIKSWSILGEDGEPAKINADNIGNGTLPICLLDAIWGEIYKRMYPSQARLAFLPQ